MPRNICRFFNPGSGKNSEVVFVILVSLKFEAEPFAGFQRNGIQGVFHFIYRDLLHIAIGRGQQVKIDGVGNGGGYDFFDFRSVKNIIPEVVYRNPSSRFPSIK